MKAGPATCLFLALALLVACARGAAQPSTVDTRNDGCARCRMTVSDVHFAAQLAAPGEDALFFDDLGCLRDHLAARRPLPSGSVAFVADHRTGAWVRASQAVFTHRPSLQTPMASHLLAHADAASRDLDRAAEGGTPVPAVALFGPGGPPDGAP